MPIKAVSGPFAPGFDDYWDMMVVQTIGYLDVPYGRAKAYLDAFAATTNENQLAYLFLRRPLLLSAFRFRGSAGRLSRGADQR